MQGARLDLSYEACNLGTPKIRGLDDLMHRGWRPGGMEAGSLDGDSAACSLEAASEGRFSLISMDLEDLVSQA